MALVKYNVREVSNFVSDIMEKVAALKVLAVVKKQSLVDLKELYDENLLDEMKYNELIEEINADFEKKKVDLMESVVPKTSPIAHTVDNVIANTPVSALNTSVTLMDEDEGVPSYFHALPSATWEVQESINLKDQGFVGEHFLFFMEKEDNWMVVQVAQRDSKNNFYKLRPAKRKNEHLTNLGITLPTEFFDEMKAEKYGETWYHIQDMKSYMKA